VAVGIIVALALTYILSSANLPAWWVLPGAVLVVLPMSLWRAAHREPPQDCSISLEA
jgi:hypothetical protein